MANKGSATTELDFEAAIEAWLVDHAGDEKADKRQFNRMNNGSRKS